jgi:hypothetical protein
MDACQEYSEPSLSESRDAAGDVNNSDETFEQTTDDAYLYPNHVTNRVFCGQEVAETHRTERATPQGEDVIDSRWEVLELKGFLHRSGIRIKRNREEVKGRHPRSVNSEGA